MPLTDTQHTRADAMLDDGCSYLEIGRTLNVRPELIRKTFPGRGWTYRQAGQYRAAMRQRQTACNTPGCDRKHKAKGLCATCYRNAARARAKANQETQP